MSYSNVIRESLVKVEASCERRLHETFPGLSPQDREQILRKFPPRLHCRILS